jgi:hypothetical protein
MGRSGYPPPPPSNEPHAQIVWASAFSVGPGLIPVSRNTGALVECLYCGRINQYDDRTSCPGCGAPIDPKQGDHR